MVADLKGKGNKQRSALERKRKVSNRYRRTGKMVRMETGKQQRS
jgi:hypothetical protein